jgi:uncharacterized protein
MTSEKSDPIISAPLTDAEVSELDELLMSAPDDRDPLDVAMLDGFLAGVLLQPEPLLTADWLPLVFDAQGRATILPGAPQAVERATDLINRRHQELAAYIAAREPFDPIIFELEDENGKALGGKAAIGALEPWAAGFANALDTFPALFDCAESDDNGAAALIGILRHLPVEDDESGDEGQRAARSKADIDRDVPLADLDEAIDDLVASVLDLADISRPRRPAERSTPKVGRNDPCYCGSGRKFKQCHGK